MSEISKMFDQLSEKADEVIKKSEEVAAEEVKTEETPAEEAETTEVVESAEDAEKKKKEDELDADSSEEVSKSVEHGTIATGIASGVDVKELEEKLSKMFTSVQEDIVKSTTESQKNMDLIAKSLIAVMGQNDSLEKSLNTAVETVQKQESIIKNLEGRLEAVEKTPLERKSVINGVEAVEKSFVGNGEQEPQLSKAQVLAKLSEELQKGNPNVTSMDIVKFESTNELSDVVRGIAYSSK